MTLWLLVGASFLASISSFTSSLQNKKLLKQVKIAAKQNGIYGFPILLLTGVSSFVMMVLWIVYAIEEEDFRFALIPLMPVLATYLAKGLTHFIPPEKLDKPS